MIPISSNRSSRIFHNTSSFILPIYTNLRLSSENFKFRDAKHPCLKVFRASEDLSESDLQVKIEICLICEFLGHFIYFSIFFYLLVFGAL